jgi:hypothetical protein
MGDTGLELAEGDSVRVRFGLLEPFSFAELG